jgi:predicted dehydrogenase
MAMKKLRWGVLGVSNFAMRKVIPAVRGCEFGTIAAIASRDLDKAKTAAKEMGIETAHGSYEDLLADSSIDVIYNPLPNHMHVPWSVRAADAGKHVLCEKPVALSPTELRELIVARDRNRVQIGEAFMIRYHPQWLRVLELVRGGAIGDLRAVSTAFSYFNRKAENVRNNPSFGGGGLFDIGCYAIHVSRWLFGAEPVTVSGVLQNDPDFQVDRLASAVMEFPCGHAVFVCSTQMVPYQRVQIFGTTGRIEVEIPFNAVPGEQMRLRLDDGSDVKGSGVREELVAGCDQYTLEVDGFSQAVLGQIPLACSLEDSFGNAAAIEAVFASAKSGSRGVPVAL